jgi:hypothetical protein
VTLDDLAELLAEYSAGLLALDALQARFTPLLAGDPLNVELSDETRWVADHEAERLFWRLLYLFESQPEDTAEARRTAARVVRCLADTRSPGTTFELLPLLLDEERFRAIIAKHRARIISRTSFLSVLAESGYPDHVKLWLRHASPDALDALARSLGEGRYAAVAAGLERPPS